MVFALLVAGITLMTLLAVVMMLLKLRQLPAETLSPALRLRLLLSGFVAFVADTLGVGSFAVNVALARMLGTFHDEELPAVNNGAQVIPGAIESLFFMQMVDVDITTLLTLVAGTCAGGVLGGFLVPRLPRQTLRLIMVVCFTLVALLLLGSEWQLLPVGGDLMALQGARLTAGFFAMMLCGALTSAGIGLFAMVQGALFLLNVSPLVAFPVMMVAGASQQPLTALMFLQRGCIPLKKTLIFSLAGCVGVLVTVPLVHVLSSRTLHLLLVLVLVYNVVALFRAWQSAREGASFTARVPAPGN
ncbi:TSUP family transporter [Legionella geestiana]|nr:sulfite exporter TauE/SafE family protein [Legionella geestiana]QDQ39985.1 TSUP family transporter [Legionella geestiana]